jgi:hypothetical protein
MENNTMSYRQRVRFDQEVPNPVRIALFTMGLALIVTLSSFLQNASFGGVVLGLYGLAAIIYRIDSLTTFKMAVIAFVFIPLSYILGFDPDITGAFAVYAYILLAIALVCTLREHSPLREYKEAIKKEL